MDVKYVNPFIESFSSVMPQLGFENIKIGQLTVKEKEVNETGVIAVVGIVGDIRGNAVYTMSVDAAKTFASTMMMGMPVEELDDMAKSALSELSNMLTATAATAFSTAGITVDISTPTLLQGENVSVKLSADPILCVQLFADGTMLELNVSFEK